MQINNTNLELLRRVAERMGINTDLSSDEGVNAALYAVLSWVEANYRSLSWAEQLVFVTRNVLDMVDKLKGDVERLYVNVAEFNNKLLAYEDGIRSLSKEVEDRLKPELLYGCKNMAKDIINAYTFLTTKKYVIKAVGTENYKAILNAVSLIYKLCIG